MSFKDFKPVSSNPFRDDADQERQFRTVYIMMKRKYPDATAAELEGIIADHIASREKRQQEREEMNAMRKRVNARTRDRQGVFDDQPDDNLTLDEVQELKNDYPGAWLTVEAMGNKLNSSMKIRKLHQIIAWHRKNGTLDSLKDTYRGDFYEPIKGSPEAKVYWGDFAPKLKNVDGAPATVSQMLQYEIAEEVSKFYHRNPTKRSAFDWVYVKHFAMKVGRAVLQIDTDLGSFNLDEFEYVTSVENNWDGFIETLKRHEGNDVWLCFDVSRKTRTLIDVHIHNNWDRIQDQWKVTSYEKVKTKDAYNGVIEGRKKTLDGAIAKLQQLHMEKDQLDQAIQNTKNRAQTVQIQIEDDYEAQETAIANAEKDHLHSLDKISSFMKSVQDKQVQDNPRQKQAGPLSKPTEAKKVTIPVEVRRQKLKEPDQTNENELLKAQLRASEAEKRELINKDRIMTMVRGIKEWAATTEEEKDLMFQTMVNEDIKELTAEEKKQFHSDAEKLRAKLANAKEPFLVTLPSPHQPEMLALRGGIEHKGSKLLIQLEEWGKGNTCLVTLPDYNVRLLACLATDRKNKTAIAAITFKHPEGQKWKSIEEEITGVTAKFQPGIPIHQYLSWNKETNDRLFIANQQMSA